MAGKITDCANFIDNFAQGCDEVRAMGYDPINPCDHMPEGWTYVQYLTYDLHLLLNCSAVYALSNWKESKGATIEVNLALALGKKVIYQ